MDLRRPFCVKKGQEHGTEWAKSINGQGRGGLARRENRLKARVWCQCSIASIATVTPNCTIFEMGVWDRQTDGRTVALLNAVPYGRHITRMLDLLTAGMWSRTTSSRPRPEISVLGGSSNSRTVLENPIPALKSDPTFTRPACHMQPTMLPRALPLGQTDGRTDGLGTVLVRLPDTRSAYISWRGGATASLQCEY